jgi:hypothetical protein
MGSGTEQCQGAPGDGASDAPIGSKVEATFSKAMDETTIGGSTFTPEAERGSRRDA